MNHVKKYMSYVYGKHGVERATELYHSLRLISILIVDDLCGSGCYRVVVETDDEDAEPYIIREGFALVGEVMRDYKVP